MTDERMVIGWDAKRIVREIREATPEDKDLPEGGVIWDAELPPFDWDQVTPELLEAFTETIADNPPDKPAGMVTNVWALEILEELSDRGYVLVPRRR